MSRPDTSPQIAAYLDRSPSAISLGIQRFKQKWLNDPAIQKALNAKM
jgi:hypothetical protein